MAGRRQMIFSGNRSIVSLDPKTGETIWNMEGPTEQFVASMVDDGQAVFMTAGFPDYHVMAIRPDGTGNITKSQVKWHVQNAKCYVPSPVVAGPFLFVADDRGTANCFSTETGERYWQERLGPHYSASLATAGGLVYFLADDGLMKVVRPGKSLEVVAENPLGETTYASPALSQGRVFLRSEKHLWCLGTK
jgi:outer membrane protein assembly factor BamB